MTKMTSPMPRIAGLQAIDFTELCRVVPLSVNPMLYKDVETGEYYACEGVGHTPVRVAYNDEDEVCNNYLFVIFGEHEEESLIVNAIHAKLRGQPRVYAGCIHKFYENRAKISLTIS